MEGILAGVFLVVIVKEAPEFLQPAVLLRLRLDSACDKREPVIQLISLALHCVKGVTHFLQLGDFPLGKGFLIFKLLPADIE